MYHAELFPCQPTIFFSQAQKMAVGEWLWGNVTARTGSTEKASAMFPVIQGEISVIQWEKQRARECYAPSQHILDIRQCMPKG